MTTNEQTVSNAIEACVKARRESRNALGQRIVDLLDEIPLRTTMEHEGIRVEVRNVFCGCSQWSNRRWDVTGYARGVLVGDHLVMADMNGDVHDGNNLHTRKTGWYRDRDGCESIPVATGAMLRELAGVLPAMLTAYMAGQREEADRNREALAAL